MFSNIKSVYFIGIGGISMSALALILKSRGIIVKGSDVKLSEITDRLQTNGIEIVHGDCPQFVEECDAIVFTGAIPENNQDLILAKKLGKLVYSRSQLLGFLSKEKKTISVAGTHGKTTTTGMISCTLLHAGLDPTIHIGGLLNAINSNLHLGEGDCFVTEACEYKDAFLSLSSFVSVVLNIEEDHLDYFKSFDNIISSFNQFIENTDQNGTIVYNFDNCNGKLDSKILKRFKNISFGFSDGADLQAQNVFEFARGRYSFDAFFKGKCLSNFKLACFGRHNIINALATIAVAICLNVKIEDIVCGIEDFKGIGRRMELIRDDSPLIIHDYAHHPQEIEESLKTIKSLSDNKLVCIFQPHTFSRTKDLYNEFLSCFDFCDEVWFLPIYPAREKEIKGISSENLAKDLNLHGKPSRFFSSFETCKQEILKDKNFNCSFAILGAGDIEILAKMLKR